MADPAPSLIVSTDCVCDEVRGSARYKEVAAQIKAKLENQTDDNFEFRVNIPEFLVRQVIKEDLKAGGWKITKCEGALFYVTRDVFDVRPNEPFPSDLPHTVN